MILELLSNYTYIWNIGTLHPWELIKCTKNPEHPYRLLYEKNSLEQDQSNHLILDMNHLNFFKAT